jgi:cytochrome P450
MKELHKLNGATVEPFPVFSKLTLGVIVECAFGGLLHDNDGAVDLWHDAVTSFSSFFLTSQLFGDRVNSFLPLPANRKFFGALRKIRELVQGAIDQKRHLLQQRRENNDGQDGDCEEGPADLLEALLLARDEEGNPMPDQLIQDECLTFLFAGHDTSSNLLSWTMYFLSRHPEVVTKLREEIDRVWAERQIKTQASQDGDEDEEFEGQQRGFTHADVPHLHYCKNVLQETLRMRPPVPILDRLVGEDCELGGVRLEKGTYCMISFIGAHHDPHYWPNPLQFRPERFGKESEGGDHGSRKHPYAFCPFSAGSRNCVGQKFALLESTLALAELIRNFDVVADPNEHVEMMFVGTMSPINLHVSFVPRS